jgi:hypothetical protein
VGLFKHNKKEKHTSDLMVLTAIEKLTENDKEMLRRLEILEKEMEVFKLRDHATQYDVPTRSRDDH